MDVSATRRELIASGAGAAALAALPASLFAPASALAQGDAETDAVERLLELERALGLAYAEAGARDKLSTPSKGLTELFATHADRVATALEEALEQLGVDPDDASDDPAAYPELKGFDPKSPEREMLQFLADLELELIAGYERETVELEAEDLIRTAAEVGASHAQHLVALRLALGDDAGKLTELPHVASDA